MAPKELQYEKRCISPGIPWVMVSCAFPVVTPEVNYGRLCLPMVAILPGIDI